jgi:hypothetical protein
MFVTPLTLPDTHAGMAEKTSGPAVHASRFRLVFVAIPFPVANR